MWGTLIWAYLTSAGLLMHLTLEICGNVEETACPDLNFLPGIRLGAGRWASTVLPLEDWLIGVLKTEPFLFKVMVVLGVIARLGEIMVISYYLSRTFLVYIKTSVVLALSAGAVAVFYSLI